MAATRTMTPRERLRFFFTTVEPKNDSNRTTLDIIALSIEEWTDLAGRLLDKSLAEKVCHHDFLEHLKENETEALEGLSVQDIVAIGKAYGIDGARQDLASQFAIDGFDVWLGKQDIHRVTTMLTSCGVQPALVQAAAAASRDRLNDFLITLMFPEKEDRENHGDFLASLKAIHSAPTVEDFNTTPTPGTPLPEGAGVGSGYGIDFAPTTAGSSNDVDASRGKRARDGEGEAPTSGASGTTATAPDLPDDLVISAETLPGLLERNPELIPREILKAHRKPIAKGITEFSLENHYTMPELREFVNTNDVPCPRKQLKVDVARSILAYLDKPAAGEGDDLSAE